MNVSEPVDERHPMTSTEQSTWWTLLLIPLAAIIYFAIILPRLADTPASALSWQVPMIVAIGASIVGIILGTIATTVIATARTREAESGTDLREKQIERYGERLSATIAATGAAGVLALAMLGVEQFWIGNAVFLLGVIGAVVGSIAKIRAYRGVFRE